MQGFEGWNWEGISLNYTVLYKGLPRFQPLTSLHPCLETVQLTFGKADGFGGDNTSIPNSSPWLGFPLISAQIQEYPWSIPTLHRAISLPIHPEAVLSREEKWSFPHFSVGNTLTAAAATIKAFSLQPLPRAGPGDGFIPLNPVNHLKAILAIYGEDIKHYGHWRHQITLEKLSSARKMNLKTKLN